MITTRKRSLALALLAAIALSGARVHHLEAQGRASVALPVLQVDPLWPRPLPNHWILGSITGVAVDRQDHIWVVHRGFDSLNPVTEAGLATTPVTAETCCAPAPPVLEFDQAGNLVGHWGGPGQGYTWPQSPGGLAIDAKGNVWITAAGPPDVVAAGRGSSDETGRAARGGAPAAAAPPPAAARGTTSAAAVHPQDAHILEFTRTGQFVRQIGKAGSPAGSDSLIGLNRPAAVGIDDVTGDVYVADGFGNHRVVVFSGATGAYARHWGAYGAKPDDANGGPYDPAAPPAKQFRAVTCVEVAKDGLVYVCDRRNDRIQVFKKDGTFVKEVSISSTTRGNGSVWDLALSSDPQQQLLYVADGQDEKIVIVARDTLTVLGSIGDGGRQPGQFYAVGSVAVDSKGNVYTGEMYEGKRVQKFIRK